MARFIKGFYKKKQTGKRFKRTDILLKGQKAKTVAKHVASIHGSKLLSYKTFFMTEKQFRKKYKF